MYVPILSFYIIFLYYLYGSRGIYKDGWYACTFGPLIPWVNAEPGLADWDSAKAKWELYNLKEDFSQANDRVGQYPEKLAELKKLFLEQAGENQVFPIGAGIWLRIHPEDVITSPYRSKEFDETTTQMPEFTASGLGKKSITVTTKTECGENASGVLYALGGSGGGLTCCMDDGYLVFEYNHIIVQGFIAKSEKKFSAGKHAIVVDTTPTAPRPGSPADIVLTIDGEEVARTAVAMTALAAFTASESFNVGIDLGSTVFRDYFQRRPCRFNDKIKGVRMVLKETPCFLTACSIPTFLEPI